MLAHSFWKVKLNKNVYVKSGISVSEYIIWHYSKYLKLWIIFFVKEF